jgi:phosphatidylinositol-3-phosphatase
MLVVLENRDYGSVVGSSDSPYTNRLIRNGGLATSAYAQTHPSLPNYLTLISGSTYGITNDCTDCTATGPNLADQLEGQGRTWRAYMGSMPGPCFKGASDGGYALKHDPFLYFPQIRDDANRCRQVVPLDGMIADLNSAAPPDFVFAVPNSCDNGHDCGNDRVDQWLANTMPSVLNSAWYRAGGIVIVTWDEATSSERCCNGADGGHIATVVLSQSTPPGSRSDTAVDTAGILRTVETIYGLPYLELAGCSCSGDLMPLIPR